MSKRDDFTFNGFEQANTTPVPDILFDELLSQLTGAELKVLLYIIRRTRGFKKDTDAISLSQFQNGIITKDRKQLDKGCGVGDRQTIIDALASLEKKKCIVSEKTKTVKGDNATTLYRIFFSQEVVGKSNQGSREKPTTVVGKTYHGGRENGTTVVGITNSQETVLQQTDSQETVLQESVTPTIAHTPACGANAPALSFSFEQYQALPRPISYEDALAYLKPHGPLEEQDAVEVIQLAVKLWTEAHEPLVEKTVDQEKGQTDGSNSTYRRADYAASRSDNSSISDLRETPVEQEGLTDGHDRCGSVVSLLADGHPGNARSSSPHPSGKMDVAQQIPSTSTPVQEVPPLATLSKMPEQAALMAAAEPKARAKAAPKKAEPEHKGPPVAPPSEMEWSTRKCLQWFDFWRGAPLIGTYKNSQASTCAKGLAANYTEQQVIDARTDMEADIYWMSHGGVDVCEVANNIHKYVKKRQSKQQQPAQSVPVGPRNLSAQMKALRAQFEGDES